MMRLVLIAFLMVGLTACNSSSGGGKAADAVAKKGTAEQCVKVWDLIDRANAAGENATEEQMDGFCEEVKAFAGVTCERKTESDDGKGTKSENTESITLDGTCERE